MLVVDPASQPAAVVTGRYGGDAAAWDAFVRCSQGGTFFHLTGWKDALEQTFGFKAHYLAAHRGSELVGVLPLFELRAPGMARCLLSLPFAVEGGVCSAEPGAHAALDAAALDLAAARGARWVELRDGRAGAGFTVKEARNWRFRRPLHPDPAMDFAALPPKRRNMIRQGMRHGLQARSDPADLPLFHDLYARTARRFGTPVFSLRYFRTLLECFPDQIALMTVRRGNTPAAAVLAFFFGDTVLPYYIGGRREFFRYAVNDFLYWELMRYAAARGARNFDFGRSRAGTGAFAFKRWWGCTPEPLRYRVAMLDGSAGATRAGEAGVAWLQRAWRRLPLPLTKRLGPLFVSRYGPYYT